MSESAVYRLVRTLIVGPINDLYIIQLDSENGSRSTLAEGFTSQQQALDALMECLTYAAPPPQDLTTLEEAVAPVQGMMDRITDLEQALQTLGDRFAEFTVRPTAVVATRQPVRPLAGAPTAVNTPRPSIRRPAVERSIGMESHAGAITGGAMRGRHGGQPAVIDEPEDFEGNTE